MIPNFNREFIIGGLLLATLALTLANRFIERSVELNVSNFREITCTDDRAEGGTSQAHARTSGEVFKFSYTANAEEYANPYATISIHPNNDFETDLSWVEHFDIEIGSDKPDGELLLLHIRNFEPTISTKEDTTSRKYNEALLSVSNEIKKVRVKSDQFLVPTWWKQRYRVKGDAAYPSFKNVEWFEFSTHGDVGSGEFEIRSVKCSGNWINAAVLDKALLWTWLGGVLVGVVYRMIKLKRKLNEKTASAMELLQYNNLLIFESATYHELARRDPLTGLFNRYGLEGKFEELSVAGGFAYALILFDLDNFKQVNDAYGHCYGDRVLFDVARTVKAKMGKSDIVARWGGDEFLLILNGRSLKEAKDFAEEIRQSVMNSDLEYTCSFGISKSEAGVSFESTLRQADGALYDSKNNGRNAINIYRKLGPERRKMIPVQNPAAASAKAPVEPAVVPLTSMETPTSEFSIYD